jgi:hypothetical protein
MAKRAVSAMSDNGLTDGLAEVLAGDALTPEEEKYFTSHGDTSALSDDAAQSMSSSVSAVPDTSRAQTKSEPSEADRYRTELAQEREMRVRTDERLKLLAEALSPQQQADERQAVREDPRPDPERDVFGYMAWQERRSQRLEQALAETQQAFVQHHNQINGERAAQQFISAYRQDAVNFARQTPDFREAYQYILADRDRELQEMGYTDPNQRLQIITAEERDLVTRNLQNRRSPAAAIYALAKGRGFKNSGRGPGGTGDMSVAAIANLSDDEFASLTARFGGLDNILKKIR